MHNAFSDIRYGLRLARKHSGSTAVAVLTLGLAIGANTAVFSVGELFLFRPVPFAGLDRLVMFQEISPRNRSGWNDVSAADFVDIRRMATSFERIAAYNWRQINLTGVGEPERLRGFVVSPGFFETVGVRPAIGRSFRAEEEQPGRDDVAILSQDLWARRFESNPSVVGRSIELDHRAYKIVGVMPNDFDFPQAAEIWTPLSFSARDLEQRGVRDLLPIARLKPGVPLAQAQAEGAAIMHQLAAVYPETNSGVEAQVVPLRDFITPQRRQDFIRLLIGAALFVLLVACANLANLQLARAAGRRSEIAIRAALGASRRRVVRQLLTESIFISLVGAALGCLFAVWGVSVIRASIPSEIAMLVAGWKDLSVDRGAILFTMIVAAAAGCLAGIWPALRLSRAGVFEVVASGRRAIGGRGVARSGGVLVIAEASLTFALVVGAALLTRGFVALMQVQPGLDPSHVLTFHLALNEGDYKTGSQIAAQHRRILTRFAALGQGTKAAAAMSVPYQIMRRRTSEFAVVGRPPAPPNKPLVTQIDSVSEGYFDTLRIPLVEGRAFAVHDGDNSPPVAIVTETFRKRFFPNENPLGKRIRLGRDATAVTIVGVVADIRDGPFDRDIFPMVYRPLEQGPPLQAVYALRTNDPLGLVPDVRSALAEVVPGQPIFDVMTMDRLISNRMTELQFIKRLMFSLGALALLLSTVGLYGLMALNVAERTREIGVRVALGALPSDILRRSLGRGLALIGTGLALGLAWALMLGRLLSSLIFGVTPTDPVALLIAFGALTMTALIASYVPARRAARTDPVVALRSE